MIQATSTPWDVLSEPADAALATPTTDTVATLWEQRHVSLGPWRSGGDRGLSAEENYEFYALRLGRMLELIRRHAGRERGLRILDAGCGQGHLTDALRRCGHRVVGIDASPTAIARARAAYGPHFTTGGLDELRPRVLFDVIVCIDVLFHVLDEARWNAAISAFARYAAADAVLIVTDAFPAERYAPHAHILHRTVDEYTRAFAAHDFASCERMPYAFGGNAIQFDVYRRVV